MGIYINQFILTTNFLNSRNLRIYRRTPRDYLLGSFIDKNYRDYWDYNHQSQKPKHRILN